MFKQKIILLTANLFLVSGLALPKVVQAQNSAQAPVSLNGTEAELISIAEAALKTENDILVNGNQIAALKRNPRAIAAQAALESRYKKALNRRALLAVSKIAYTSFQTNLKVKNVQINGNTATLEAIEDTSLTTATNGQRFEHPTKHGKEHRFIFTFINGQWELTSDQLLNNNEANPSPPKPDSRRIPADIKPTVIAPTEITISKPQLVASTLLKHLSIFPNSQPTVPKFDSSKSNLLALVGVSKQEIVNYAHSYADVYNASYRDFSNTGTRGGDCTNFISQALRLAGWQDKNTGADHTNFQNWWYSFYGQTYTWINADYWFDFINNNRDRGYPLSYFNQAEPGDIVQIDFAPFDNVIDHSMIVTHKNSDGKLYVAYHSSKTLDEPFDDVLARNPTANFYVWHINASY